MDLSSLPEELRSLVRKQLETGRYASVEELLGEALRVHSEQEAWFDAHREPLREKIERGVAQADRGELADGNEAMGEIRRRVLDRRARGR